MIQPLMDLELDPLITSSQEDSVVELEQEQEQEYEEGQETKETEPVIAGSRFARLKGYKTGRRGAYKYFQRKKNNTNTPEAGTDSLGKPLKRLDVHKQVGVWKRGDSNEPLDTEIQRKNLNKLLKPKCAISLLMQLKPGCSIKIFQESFDTPYTFVAHVEYENGILGSATATSKSAAKNLACENALKEIFKTERLLTDVKGKSNSDENLSLIPLASYALWKLFEDWKKEPKIQVAKKPPTPPKKPVKKERKLPDNPLSWHPSSLLNYMIPGLHCFEVRRVNDCVVMGYKIDGIVYTGTAKGRKDAQKEAAKAVLYKFFNVDFTLAENQY